MRVSSRLPSLTCRCRNWFSRSRMGNGRSLRAELVWAAVPLLGRRWLVPAVPLRPFRLRGADAVPCRQCVLREHERLVRSFLAHAFARRFLHHARMCQHAGSGISRRYRYGMTSVWLDGADGANRTRRCVANTSATPWPRFRPLTHHALGDTFHMRRTRMQG